MSEHRDQKGNGSKENRKQKPASRHAGDRGATGGNEPEQIPNPLFGGPANGVRITQNPISARSRGDQNPPRPPRRIARDEAMFLPNSMFGRKMDDGAKYTPSPLNYRDIGDELEFAPNPLNGRDMSNEPEFAPNPLNNRDVDDELEFAPNPLNNRDVDDELEFAPNPLQDRDNVMEPIANPPPDGEFVAQPVRAEALAGPAEDKIEDRAPEPGNRDFQEVRSGMFGTRKNRNTDPPGRGNSDGQAQHGING